MMSSHRALWSQPETESNDPARRRVFEFFAGKSASSRQRLEWAALFAGVLAAVLPAAKATGETNGLLSQEVYIWQRTWNAPVRESLAQHASPFSRLVALKAEVVWKQTQPQIIRVALDWAALRAAKRPIGLALRIGAYPGPFESNSEITTSLVEQASSLVAEGKANQLQVGELQIDFDCAESKLDGYRVWVEAIRRKIAPVPLTITVLPTWLNQASFEPLISATDGYVLQVHSFERPKDADAPFTLCDPAAARRAAERAAQFGVPFRVALPTYGYVMAFEHAGRKPDR